MGAISGREPVSEPAEEQKREKPAPLGAFATEIVVAYVTRNSVTTADLGHVIEAVGRGLGALGREETKPPMAKPAPAVPVRQSIQEDHLVCLICGRQQRALRRHLNAAHQFTPDAYRELFGLKSNYPMAAPSYARFRSEMAKRLGLERRGRAAQRGRQSRGAG
jgi:predicted transcriptional regulator